MIPSMGTLSQEVLDPSLFLLLSTGMVWRQFPSPLLFVGRWLPSSLHANFWVKLKEN